MIKFILTEDVLPLRNSVLREGKFLLKDCIFENDDHPKTFHLGYYQDDELVCVASFHPQKHANFEGEAFQLRGMAVLSGNQKQGFGSLLIKEAEKIALEQNIKIIWFNAREIAVDFYKRINYVILGTRFEIEGVGPHFIMYKKLN